MKARRESTYVFIYEDRKGNELTRQEYKCYTLKEARDFAKLKLANSMMNDLYKIVVKKKY